MAGNLARCIIVLCSLLALDTSADLIVDLGLAKNYTFLDVGLNPANNMLFRKGTFRGNVGWAGGAGTEIELNGTLEGNIHRAAGSSLKIKSGSLLGTDSEVSFMQDVIDDVDFAMTQYASLTQDIYLGDIDQSGGLTIDRTDEYTVVDMDSLKLSSGTLTLNGQADDIFYIRISNAFDLSNVDVVVNGTDASRVFFIYDGDSDFTYDGGDFLGTIVAPNAAVSLSKLNGFNGSVISGNGFSIGGRTSNNVIIPEPAVLSLIGLFGIGSVSIRRIFKDKTPNSGT
ncbi:MAG: ice-binding family protein [Verrucomicrobiota bacterium]